MSTSKNYSILSFSEDIRGRIRQGELDAALNHIHDYVERIITEPLCTSQVYGARVLDELCQEIGKKTLETHAQSPRSHSGRLKPVFAYIVTKLQESGGHTHVIRDFIKAQPDACHVVLSTELAGSSNISSLMETLNSVGNVKFETAPRVSFLQKLRWLQGRLIEMAPNRTYLFNHHQDSVAIAAVQPGMGFDSSFYHHGDHHLCLGVYLSHCEHIDPHPMGYYNCRDALGISNTYIPLTLDDSGDRPESMEFMENDVLTTCTAARSNKIEIPYFVSYLDIIPSLLRMTGGRHIHIGRLTPWALYKLKRGLQCQDVGGDRFVYIPWVPNVWKALHQYGVDLYIASFPYGGGLTLIEAMGSGTPVALHRHMHSRILSGVDLAYPEAFSWRYPAELLEYCAKLKPEELRAGGRLSRRQYEKHHRKDVLVDLLSGQSRRQLVPTALKVDFVSDPNEWASWAERQLSCMRVFQRGAYRLARSVRRRFF